MVVAVLVVRVVQVPADEIVDMVPVRDGVVPALPTVVMAALMPSALVGWRASHWIRFATPHRDAFRAHGR
jgi:hypothetical protein